MPKGGWRHQKYDESMAEDIIPLFAEGQSICEIAAELGIGRRTFYEWRERYPEFGEAVERGVELSEAWWMRQGRDHLTYGPTDKRIDTALWMKNMTNRFKWREKTDVTSGGEPMKTGPIEVVIVDPAADQD